MRVLILHMRYHPDLTGTGPLVTDLAIADWQVWAMRSQF